MPILELDDKLVYESLITADYLDELYPGARLLNSSDPFKKAQDRIFMELFQQVNLITLNFCAGPGIIINFFQIFNFLAT